MVKLARRIIVHGMVQGVGFRYYVQRVGMRKGITGDVRNLPDATVEIVAEGPPGQVEDFIKEVRRGPSMACVERLDIQDIAVTGRHLNFTIEGW
jgi:acylphosphatase